MYLCLYKHTRFFFSCTLCSCTISDNMLQVPILTEQLDRALNKVRWAPTGQLLACGDFEGGIHIYEAGEVSHMYMYT